MQLLQIYAFIFIPNSWWVHISLRAINYFFTRPISCLGVVIKTVDIIFIMIALFAQGQTRPNQKSLTQLLLNFTRQQSSPFHNTQRTPLSSDNKCQGVSPVSRASDMLLKFATSMNTCFCRLQCKLSLANPIEGFGVSGVFVPQYLIMLIVDFNKI